MFFGIRSIPASGHRALPDPYVCASLQLTHISSFVTVTKLARLGREMCRLWLTAHVWILYFESHADLSNTGSVRASLTLLSSTGAAESCSRFSALTTCSLICPALSAVCVCVRKSREWILSSTRLFLPCCFNRRWVPESRCFQLVPQDRKIQRGENTWNIFLAWILARLPVWGRKKKSETCILWSNQSLKLHPESFSNNSLILGLQRGVDVCCRQRKSVKSVPCDANSLKYCFHNCAS